MTSPRSTYGGGYYTAPPFADTPIYDSLVAERGTPQIAPIRVPSAYDTGSQLPALPSALPALPAGPSHHTPAGGYQYTAAQSQAPAPYPPQQPAAPRGYGYPAAQQPPQMRPVAPQPVAPQPIPPRQMPGPNRGMYDDPYGRQHPSPGY